MYKPNKKHLAYLFLLILFGSSCYVIGVSSNGQNPTWDEVKGIFNVPWFNASTGVNAPKYVLNDKDVTDILEYPEQQASYIIFNSSNVVWAKNASTGQIDYGGTLDAGGVDGTNLSAVWEAVRDNGLTSERDWKEKVILKGKFTLSASLLIPSYTILEIQGSITLANNVNDHIIKNAGASNTDITILGGELQGNSANQATTGRGIHLTAVTRFNIWGVTINDTKIDGIQISTSKYGVIDNIRLEDAGNHAVFVGHGSSYITVSNIVSIHPGTEHICIEWYAGTPNHHITVTNVVGYDAQNAGFYVQHAYKITLSNLVSEGSQSVGLRIYDSFDVSVANVRVYDVENSFGVWVQNAHSISLVNIAVNSTLDETYGTGIMVGGGVTDITLVGCTTNNSKLDSFSFSGVERISMSNCIGQKADRRGLSLIGVSDAVVNNCIFNATQEAIVTTSNRINLSNNIFSNIKSSWHYVKFTTVNNVIFNENIIYSDVGTQPDYILWIDNLAALSVISIADNFLLGPTDIGVLYIASNDATSVIKFNHNTGFITENSGTQTCADNENIAHGLAGIPTLINITPMNDTYDSVPVIVTIDWSGVDATNIQVGLYWVNGTTISDDIILVAWRAEYEP